MAPLPEADAAPREDASAAYDPDTNTIRWICAHGRPGPVPRAGATEPFPRNRSGAFVFVAVLGVDDARRNAVLCEVLSDRRRPGVSLSFSYENGIADSFAARFVLADWSSWRRGSSLIGDITLVEPEAGSFDPMERAPFDPSWSRARRAWYTQIARTELALTVECDSGLRTVRLVPRDGGPEPESRETDAGPLFVEQESPTESDLPAVDDQPDQRDKRLPRAR